MKKKQLDEVREYILQTAINRRKGGSMAGGFIKDGTPDKMLKNTEMEFFIGAYSCFTKMMSIIEGTSHNDAMKYFPPAVMFATFGEESIIDTLTNKESK